MSAEAPPAPEDLHRMYEEAGVVLPELVRRRYEDALKFHQSVIRNRQSHLHDEHKNALERISTREKKQSVLDRRRSQIMGVLKSHGALKEFVALQAEHGRLQADAAALRTRYEKARELEETKASLDAERMRLVERLRREISDR